MYKNFEYYTPTKVVFGKDTEDQVGELIKDLDYDKVLIHYGGQSAIKSGLLDKVKDKLDEEGISYLELGGVVPNPHLSKVYEGIELGQKEGVDFVLAVGGGSVIDSAKAIALGLANPEDDVWDYFTGENSTDKALPLASILTIAATGSEMSSATVITNEKNGLKRAYGGDFLRPVFAIMNPELTMSLPDYQTFSGATDIIMHTLERFFNPYENMDLVDRISIALIKNVMQFSRVLLEDPNNYQARAELMWAGSLSHNGLTGVATGGGDWSTHDMEHEVAGLFDVTHGAGLSAIWGSWARYVAHVIPDRFEKFALEVMEVEEAESLDETIERGITAMEDFFREIAMPTNLKELGVEPSEEEIELMAKSCEDGAGGAVGSVLPLKKEDMIVIYKMALL